jgi:hypothetical protein
MTGLDKLRAAHPWPRIPWVSRHFDGWLEESTKAMLSRALCPETRLVVECGSWLGMSARHILECAPAATLICIDTWNGSPTIMHYDYLPILYECFLLNLWDERHRVIPIRADSLVGLAEVADAGLVPDVVYLDSDHTYERVDAELRLCFDAWPFATIVGDDYGHPDHPGVRQAALEWMKRSGRPFENSGNAFKFGVKL